MSEPPSDQQAGSGSLVQRACANCSSRKIRCDKGTPCANCRTAGLDCRPQPSKNRTHHQRVLITSKYERKIDEIETRLGGIERLLQTLVQRQSRDAVATASSTSTYSPHSGTPQSRFVDRTVENATPDHFEGESSLSAHSKHAHWTLESVLQAYPHVRRDSEVQAALSSLKQRLESQKSSGQSFAARVAQYGDPAVTSVLAGPALPSLAEIDHIITRHASEGSVFFLTWLPFLDSSDFRRMITDLWEMPSVVSLAMRTITYGGLYYMLREHINMNESGQDDNDRLQQHAERLLRAFEACLTRFDVLMTPNAANIIALAIGAGHAIQIADFELCWSLTAAGIRLCQMLGWHRGYGLEDNDSKDVRNRKAAFWTLYFFDKILSLRLGRSSILQDFDISLEDRHDFLARHGQSWQMWLRASLEIACIHGCIYDGLYSPASLKKSPESRLRVISDVCLRIEKCTELNNKVIELVDCHFEQMKLLVASNDVILKCLSTLAHRVAPVQSNQTFIFSDACLQAARATITAHERYISDFKKGTADWTDYVNWTILACPFTPFMVIFCYVIMTLSIEDLVLLERFVATLDAGFAETPLEAIGTFHELCSAFCTLARKYLAARMQEFSGPKPTTSTFGTSQAMQGAMQSPLVGGDQDWWLTNAFDDWLVGEQQPTDLFGAQKAGFGGL